MTAQPAVGTADRRGGGRSSNDDNDVEPFELAIELDGNVTVHGVVF